MKWWKFRAAYVDGQWHSPYYFQIDGEGKIVQHLSGRSPPTPPLSTGEGRSPPTPSLSMGNAPLSVDEDIDGYLLPGVPNAHSHSFQYAMAGLSERVVPGREMDDFWFWREQMYRLANTIAPDELLAVTTQLYCSMVEQGYTSVAEFHYLNHDFEGRSFNPPTSMGETLMEAAKRAGIHLTLIPVFYNQAAPNTPIKHQQRRFYFAATDQYLKFVESMSRIAKTNYPTVKVGYGVHSLRAARLEDITTILGTAWTDGPCHLHASEQTSDVESFVAAYGVRPIHWLNDKVPLSEKHNLVHATHIEESERKKIVASGATVVLCPTTEANLGDGIFPFREYHLEGGSWSVGSDSQVNLNPFVEMTQLELVQRMIDRRRNVLCREGDYVSGDILFDAATRGGRKSLGIDADPYAIGSYFHGVLIDPDHERIYARPLDSLLSVLCYAPEKDFVKGVYSQGKLQVDGGAHPVKEENRNAYQKAMTSLMNGLGGI